MYSVSISHEFHSKLVEMVRESKEDTCTSCGRVEALSMKKAAARVFELGLAEINRQELDTSSPSDSYGETKTKE